MFPVYSEDETLPATETATLVSSQPEEVSSLAPSLESTSAPSVESSPEPSTESSSTADLPSTQNVSSTSETTVDTTSSVDVTTVPTITEISQNPLESFKTLSTDTLNNTGDFINSFSDQIRKIIQHYQVPEPIGFPGQTVLPDPLTVPDATQSVGFGTGEFYNMTVHNLSNFTTQSVNILLDQMKVG